ncbi:MAG: hypothetical protein ACI307_10590 [Sodaliphilus sp.]
MKRYSVHFILFAILFASCNDDITPPSQEEVHPIMHRESAALA